LYRIGRARDPLAWPPAERQGEGPLHEYSVLYAGQQRRVVFLELLASLRPSLGLLAAEREVRGAREAVEAGVVDESWTLRRSIARFRLLPGQRWLDLRRIETRQALRPVFAGLLTQLGFDDFDAGTVLSPDRRLTQTVSRWAFEHGYNGVAFPSRFEPTYTNWAIFEGAAIEPVGVPEPIPRDDPDLGAVARRYVLML
jgi:hypothetical protein